MESLLESLYGTHRPKTSFELIYVDNCSEDGSVEMISDSFPEVIILKNDKPLGFGANNNLGAKKANGKYIAIINPDIQFQKGSLDYLAEYHNTLNFNAILVPKLVNPDGTLQYSARGFVTGQSFVQRILTKGNDHTKSVSLKKYLLKDINAEKTQYVDWAIGAAFFMKRSLYESLGGFDEDYFLYLEDTDLCLRAWKKGNPVIYYPKAVMIHNHMRTSSKKLKPALIHLKSYLVYFSKHGLAVNSLINDHPHLPHH